MQPKNLVFGGGVNQTIVNPFVLAIVLILNDCLDRLEANRRIVN
jgi:hypothetical protein